MGYTHGDYVCVGLWIGFVGLMLLIFGVPDEDSWIAKAFMAVVGLGAIGVGIFMIFGTP